MTNSSKINIVLSVEYIFNDDSMFFVPEILHVACIVY